MTPWDLYRWTQVQARRLLATNPDARLVQWIPDRRRKGFGWWYTPIGNTQLAPGWRMHP